MADQYTTWDQVKAAAAAQARLSPKYYDNSLAEQSGFANGEASGYQVADPNKPGWNLNYQSDGKGGVTAGSYQPKLSWIDYVPAILGTALTAGTVGPSLFGAEAGAGLGAAEAAGSYAIPTAAELSAEGFGVGGMGLTGAEGIGAAGSLVDAGIGGSAGYGAGSVAGIENLFDPSNYSNEGLNYPTPESTVNSPINVDAPTVDLSDSIPSDYSNEGRNYPAEESTKGSPINSSSPTVDLSSKFPSKLVESLAKTLMKSGGYGGSGGGGFGGMGSGFSMPANETPGMMQGQAAPQQQQAIAQALLLGNPDQPKFSPSGYMPVSQGVQPNMQMMQLAQALQQDQ